MGSEKDKLAKLEKKRIKAQMKREKKLTKTMKDSGSGHAAPNVTSTSTVHESKEPEVWYKDPAWIRTIVAIGSLVVTIIALFIAISL